MAKDTRRAGLLAAALAEQLPDDWLKMEHEGYRDSRSNYQLAAESMSVPTEAHRAKARALAGGHRIVEEDCWFSCPQALRDDGSFSCCDDTRAGGPCDCGLSERVAELAAALAEAEERGRREERRERWDRFAAADHVAKRLRGGS